MNGFSKSRRDFLRLAPLAAGATALGGAGFSLWEAHHFVVERVEMRLPRLPEAFDGFIIAQLSDVHYNHYLGPSYYARVVNEIASLQPDMIALTGDFLTRPVLFPAPAHPEQQIAECAALLSRLQPKFGQFACLGNHDVSVAPDLITEVLLAHGIRMQVNQATPLERHGARLWVIGLGCAVDHQADIARAVRGLPPEDCKVALEHAPDYAVVTAKYPVDFQISGHSHGGQIRLPLIGAPVLPPFARKYPMGFYRVRNMSLYTNRGIGVVELPLRFRCPPEITLFTLRRGPNLQA